MAILEFSAGLMSELPARVFYPGTGNSSALQQTGIVPTGYFFNAIFPYDFGIPNNSSIKYQCGILIYKGTIPTDLSTLTTWTARSSDLLINFYNTTSSTFSTTIVASTNPIVVSSTLVAASASGTATWFRLLNAGPATYSGQEVVHQIVGTVGTSGSGADLEMSTTNIVSGSNYRIQNLRISFPSTWTYT